MDTKSYDDQLPADAQNETPERPAAAGAKSFCLPTHTIDALIDAKAGTLEIASCLALAAFTDVSGQFSTASTNAVYKRTRVGWKTVKKALAQLCRREAKGQPIVCTRDEYITRTGQTPVDGPVPHSKVLHVLETFDEAPEDRVWFGGGLVEGHKTFAHPLRALTDAGPVVMRLLLLLYRLHDLQEWIGIPPSSTLHAGFAPIEQRQALGHGYHLLRYKCAGCVPDQSIIDRIVGSGWTPAGGLAAFNEALNALIALGFVYESVVVANRPLINVQAAGMPPTYRLAQGAQPVYLLTTKNDFGHKQRGEEGISGLTARLAGELRMPVSGAGGFFDGTFAAIEPPGLQFGITGVYRLRFRVSNRKNAGVSDAWSRMLEGEREAIAHMSRLRRRLGMEPASQFIAAR